MYSPDADGPCLQTLNIFAQTLSVNDEAVKYMVQKNF